MHEFDFLGGIVSLASRRVNLPAAWYFAPFADPAFYSGYGILILATLVRASPFLFGPSICYHVY
jgi:hypothetical protein